MGTGAGNHRSDPGVGPAGSSGVGRCRLRRWHRVSRRTGKAGTEICRGGPAASRHMVEAAQEAATQAKAWRKIRWREGTKGWLESRFWATRVQPSHRYQDGRPPGKEVWLLAEWPESEKSPTKYCLCDLPSDYSLRRMVRLVKCRWKIEQDYHQLKEVLGLAHYEGRNWQGWHHHVTMVMVAHAFLTLETLRNKKNFWVDPAEDAT